MTILVDGSTRVLIQGATGNQARFDIQYCLEYGTRIVGGVSPGRGGQSVNGVPLFNTVQAAVEETGANASAIYVPARSVRDAVIEAAEAGIPVMAALAENVPRHDAAKAVAAVREAGGYLVGFNTNGIISPGHCKVGGIGGDCAAKIYRKGRVGICSRSGGMSAEIALSLQRVGLGVSTCVSLGGDAIVGMRMAEVLGLFESDPATDACVIFGEPGGAHEAEVALAVKAGALRKPIIALIAGVFQERYPQGQSFGHAAAMIKTQEESATAKRRILAESGVHVATTLEQVATLVAAACNSA